MAKSPTTRQRVLVDRLITLGDWASSGKLPVKVLEIRGFGSFFRGKPKPKDVDLILRIQRPQHTTEFERFLRLVATIRRGNWGEETPKAALIRAYRGHECELPYSAIDRECDLFAEWIEGYSWNMLDPKTIVQESDLTSPESYTKRMIRRHLANLNVIRYAGPEDVGPRPTGLRCGFVVSVWSDEARDIRANLEAVLAEDVVSQNARRELAYFRVHHPMISAKAEAVRAGIAFLRDVPRRPKGSEWRWSEEWSNSSEELREWRIRLEDAKGTLELFDAESWGGRIPESCDARVMDFVDVLSETERLREEIRESYHRVELLESLRECLFHYKLGGARTTLSADDFVASEMLGRGSARKRKRVARFLVEMGFPATTVPEVARRPPSDRSDVDRARSSS